MRTLTKLLIAAISFAAVQTLNAAVLFQNAISWSSAIFCWAMVGVVAWRRHTTRNA